MVTSFLLFQQACFFEAFEPATYSPFEWDIADAESVQMDSEILKKASDKSEQLGFIHSLLVVRDGVLVWEEYFNDYNHTDMMDLRSATKSFTATLIGIAFDRGIISDLDSKVMDYFPEFATTELDSRYYDITIRHLLMMRGGFPHETSREIRDINENNLLESIFTLELINDPGEKFVYSTVQSHLLSGILTRETGMSTLDFAEQELFEPLGIRVEYWGKDYQGYYSGGTNLYLQSRDLARFGLLYLNGGSLDGKNIVSTEWINESLIDRTHLNHITWGSLSKVNYGYHWWLGELDGYSTYMAVGYGGQFIACFPELDMIVVITSETIDVIPDQIAKAIQVMYKFILPAATNS
jgi:CubicO group peptidase (beta-lactamase class C family)